jgi:hypothetical protein
MSEIRKSSKEENVRQCKGECASSYPINEDYFFFRKSSKNGKSYPSPYCKTCERVKSAAFRKTKYSTSEGKKLLDAQNLAYRSKPEKKKQINDRQNQKYELDEEFRTEMRDKAKVWKSENIEQNRLNKAKWYQDNKLRIQTQWNERFRTDPAFRLRNNLRHAIWEALVVNNGDKAGRSILKFLPYTMEELKSHLESLWEPWMSWDNYGVLNPDVRTWQIDHIVPQVNLPFNDFDHPNFLLCWSLSNLRPLEASLNIEKGARSP